MEADADELANLENIEKERSGLLKQKLAAWVKHVMSDYTTNETLNIDEATKERLKSLGYL